MLTDDGHTLFLVPVFIEKSYVDGSLTYQPRGPSLVIRATKKKKRKKREFYLSVNVISTKVLIGDTPTEDGTDILRGHPSHAKVSPLPLQRE